MKVWVLMVSDCECIGLDSIYATKELAVEALFKIRDKMVTDWEKHDAIDPDEMYTRMNVINQKEPSEVKDCQHVDTLGRSKCDRCGLYRK